MCIRDRVKRNIITHKETSHKGIGRRGVELRHPAPSPEATHFSEERLGYHRPWCWRDETTEIASIKEVEKYTSASQAQQGLRSVPEASTTLKSYITKLSAKDWQLGLGDSFFLPTQHVRVPSDAKREEENTEASTQRCSDPEQVTVRLVAAVDALVPTPSQLPRSPQALTWMTRSNRGLLTEFLGWLRILTPTENERNLDTLTITSLPQSSKTRYDRPAATADFPACRS